jgi:hypothetical protein
MGANTANGLPYPVGTDRVMDGDDAIKALAQAVDSAVFVAPLMFATHAGGVALGANATITSWSMTENIGGGLWSAGAYTIQRPGIYRIRVSLKWGSTAAASAMAIHKNGARIFLGGNVPSVAFGHNIGETVTRCVQGDVITSQVNAVMTTQSDSPSANSLFFIGYERA